MKTLSLLIASLSFCFLSNTASADGEKSVKGGPDSLSDVFADSEETMSLPDFAERLVTPQSDSEVGASTYTCRAWTTCPGGYRISCWSRGYRCYSDVIPGYRVYCSATSRSGYTQYWVYYCY